MSVSLRELSEAISGGAVGVRSRLALEPLGGPGDKIAPPTYGVENNAASKYATESRRIDGQDVPCVVLDSVASQANAMELELLAAVRDGALALPIVSTDFSAADGLADLDRVSSLQAPHRIFDALLRDSLDGDDLFRFSPIGRAITEATSGNAGALFRYAPSTLVFGGWDSTGPRGGRGAKYERALTSEIVGIGATTGVRTSSRIDPVGIEITGNTVYETDDALGWTLDPAEAKQDRGKPVLVTGGEGAAGRPSQKNHGNVRPSLDPRSGGVTVDRIEATTVLSFIQLRRLRFPTDGTGQPLADRSSAEAAARTALAALALAAVTLSFEAGFDLRSRCVLAPTTDLEFELVNRGSAASSTFTLDRASALALVSEASAAASAAGLGWETEEVLLTPAPRLVELIRRSRRLALTTPAE